MFIPALFVRVSNWKQLKCHQKRNTNNLYYCHTIEYYTAVQREWASDTCNDLEEPEGNADERSQIEEMHTAWFHLSNNARTCQSINSDRTQIGSALWAGIWVGEGRIKTRIKDTSGNDKEVHYLDCACFMGIDLCQNLSNCVLSICAVFCMPITSK